MIGSRLEQQEPRADGWNTSVAEMFQHEITSAKTKWDIIRFFITSSLTCRQTDHVHLEEMMRFWPAFKWLANRYCGRMRNPAECHRLQEL